MTSAAPARPGNRPQWSAAASLLSCVLTVPLLRIAAHNDRHYRTTESVTVDHRTGSGLFLLYGLLAALPAIAAAIASRRGRVAAGLIAAAIFCVSVLCEVVVTLAPQPWFTF